MDRSGKVELCHWAVAFVDLLGQGDKMREVSRLIDSGQDDAAVEKMKGVYFDHRSFYEAFQGSLIANQQGRVQPTIPLPSHISEEEYQAVFRRNLKVQVFSDAAMFYLPLVEDVENQPIFGINTLLSVLGIQMLSFLAQGRPFRCGVEVGFGLEMEDGKLIGPPVQNAYELESKRAQYPRIVVGEGLIEYLQNIKQVGLQNATEVQNQASKSLARISLDWLATDIDGETILNYLGADFLRKLPEDKTQAIIALAHQFVDQEQARYRNEKNSLLAIRYACLETYFAAHMPNPESET
ncbi:MAG: hypothetical protein JXR25_02330 [Pontiellaceae bacterium]|nr:hypothetical protein [Pontiellaceae bacterium]MBN2783638.1 hypothetical protein [Pontiellaceae bacterium]